MSKESPEKIHSISTDDLGKCPRSYDNDPDVDLSWLALGAKPSDIPEIEREYEKEKEKKDKKQKQESKEKRFKVMLDILDAAQKKDNVAAIAAFQEYLPQSNAERLSSILDDAYYSVKDFFKWRRVKTSLTILGSIVAGAGIGVVLGTVVFPVIGSAIGGAAGAAIGGASAFFGGTIGLGLIGGVAGSWVGTKLSKMLFRYEAKYQPSSRVTDRLHNKIGIDSKTAWRINAYLVNRAKATASGENKHLYKRLRKLAIDNADYNAMEQVAFFFCRELALINQEIAKHDPSHIEEIQALKQEASAVHHILFNLKNARNAKGVSFPKKTQDTIDETLWAYSTHPWQKRVPQVARSSLIGQRTKQRSAQRTREEKGKEKDKDYEKEKEKEHVPEILFQSEKEQARAKLLVYQDQINKENQAEIFEKLASEAQQYAKEKGNVSIRVIAGKDHKYAVQLMAAAYKAGLSPKLDKNEFPKENKAERKEIKKEARELAQIAPKKRVGYEFKPSKG